MDARSDPLNPVTTDLLDALDAYRRGRIDGRQQAHSTAGAMLAGPRVGITIAGIPHEGWYLRGYCDAMVVYTASS